MNDKFADAMAALADIANCISGDVHTLHLNYKGADFDAMHKEVTRKYYEQLDSDYDWFSERVVSYGGTPPNKNGSEGRIKYRSLEAKQYERKETIDLLDERLEVLLDKYNTVFDAMNKDTENPLSVGFASTLQNMINTWSEEYSFFNRQRSM